MGAAASDANGAGNSQQIAKPKRPTVENDLVVENVDTPANAGAAAGAGAAAAASAGKGADEKEEKKGGRSKHRNTATTNQAPQPATQLSIKGWWIGGVCGGLNPADVAFRKNPRFRFSLEQACKVSFNLMQEGRYSVALFVLSFDESDPLKSACKEAIVGKSPYSKRPVSLDVDLEARPKEYLIVPTAEIGIETFFSLDISSRFPFLLTPPADLCRNDIYPEHMRNKVSLPCIFEGHNSGGPPNSPDWLENPQFYLHVPTKVTSVFMNLEMKDAAPKMAWSFMVLPCKGERLTLPESEAALDEAVIATCPWRQPFTLEVQRRFVLRPSPNPYVIIVYAQDKYSYGNLALTLFSDVPLTPAPVNNGDARNS